MAMKRITRNAKRIYICFSGINKMGYTYLLTTALLFFVLTPGILLSLPPGGSKMVVAATHAVVFAIVHKLLHMYVY
jgi:hypothetical protein